MSFFIWLSSNADIVNHPDNRGGKFNISLFNDLKLNEQWEVGLHEMFYHGGDWPHLEKPECRIIVKGSMIQETLRLQISWLMKT